MKKESGATRIRTGATSELENVTVHCRQQATTTRHLNQLDYSTFDWLSRQIFGDMSSSL